LKAKEITLKMVQAELKEKQLNINKEDYVIIASGYGQNEAKKDYLTASPHFEPALTEWLIKKQIGLIGVDTPIIENTEEPYSPVVKMFEANPGMLLLAPLNIDIKKVRTGVYTLSCLPLPVKNISGSLCRAILIK
jgi:kynurenine formamidase